jgi:hypothetical protein
MSTRPVKVPVVPEMGLPENWIVPAATGRSSVRSVELSGLAMVNVPVPEALPDKAIFDIFVSP